MTLVLPLTVLQVQQQQSLRQRAQSTGLTIAFNPSSSSVEKGKTTNIDIQINNPANKRIDAVYFALTYDASKLTLNNFLPSEAFDEMVNNNQQPGRLSYLGANTSQNTAGTILVGTLQFLATNTSSSTIKFDPETIIAVSDETSSVSPSRQTASVSISTGATPITTSKKQIDQSCTQTPECETGLTCQYNNEFGDYRCVAANPTPPLSLTPTFTPTPTPNCTQKCTDQRTGNLDLTCYNEKCTLALTPTLGPTNTPTPTPTPTPIPCGSTTCEPNQSCKLDADNTLTCMDNPPTPTPTPTPTVIVCRKVQGDANCDGSINTLDYNIWRDEFLGNVQTKNADFDGDGQITILDFNIWYQFRGT